MKLKPEFIKDLSSNYMVLCSCEKGEEDSFILKMLIRNKIDGLLKMEIKVIDNQKYYYYNITEKQSFGEMIELCPISFLQLQKIYSKLFQLPNICKEFLIHENGIFVDPDFIYVDRSWNIIEFCYYPGLNQSLQEQMGKFTEYLLNRVDYKDEKAVLAVYALYQVSHEKVCTLERLKDVFERKDKKIEVEGLEKVTGDAFQDIKKEIEIENVKSRIKKIPIEKEWNNKQKKEEERKEKECQQGKKRKEDKGKEPEKENKKIDFSYMEERTEGQKEVLKYPRKIYIQAVFALTLGLFVLFVLLKAGMFSVHGQLDSKRYIIAVVCYIVVLGVILLFLFRKDRQFTEIEQDIDYIDWEEDYDSFPMPREYDMALNKEENYYQDAFLKETGTIHLKKEKENNDNTYGIWQETDEDMKTELLIDFCDNSIAYLESEFSGERIYLEKFPFLIGKLKKGVDYILENNKISRIHARFDYDESHYYIEDMDSTNGTSLNNIILLAHDRRLLSNGDKICFADKNFIFHC